MFAFNRRSNGVRVAGALSWPPRQGRSGHGARHHQTLIPSSFTISRPRSTFCTQLQLCFFTEGGICLCKKATAFFLCTLVLRGVSFLSFETATGLVFLWSPERIYKVRVAVLAAVRRLRISVECTRRISGVEVMKAGKQDEQGKRFAGQKLVCEVIGFLLD